MRVEAVWVDDDDLAISFENIKWWRPNGEEDADPSCLSLIHISEPTRPY